MAVVHILKQKGSDVVTVKPSDMVQSIVDLLARHRIGAVIVVDSQGGIAGIVSERDVVRAVASHGASALGREITSVMTSNVRTCSPADSVERLMELMTEHRIRHLPVADDDGKLAGIISIGDVVKARVNQLHIENQALAEYIHQGT